MHWLAVPCDWEHLASAAIEESDDGKALGAWLLDLPGARTLSVSLCGAQRKLRLGFPQVPFSPDSTLPTRAPAPLIGELHTAFGWELRLDEAPVSVDRWRRVVAPRPGMSFVRLRDPVLLHVRTLQAELAQRGVPVELRVDLVWDCCSAELAEDARLAMQAAIRRRRSRREVLGLMRIWMKAVGLQTVLRLHAHADPGRLVEARLVRALSHDFGAPLTTGAQARPVHATPDVLFGLLSLCSLAEASADAGPVESHRRDARTALAEVPF